MKSFMGNFDLRLNPFVSLVTRPCEYLFAAHKHVESSHTVTKHVVEKPYTGTASEH